MPRETPVLPTALGISSWTRLVYSCVLDWGICCCKAAAGERPAGCAVDEGGIEVGIYIWGTAGAYGRFLISSESLDGFGLLIGFWTE